MRNIRLLALASAILMNGCTALLGDFESGSIANVHDGASDAPYDGSDSPDATAGDASQDAPFSFDAALHDSGTDAVTRPDGGADVDGSAKPADSGSETGPLTADAEADTGAASDGGNDSAVLKVDAGYDAGTPQVDAGYDAGTPQVDAGHDAGNDVGPPVCEFDDTSTTFDNSVFGP